MKWYIWCPSREYIRATSFPAVLCSCYGFIYYPQFSIVLSSPLHYNDKHAQPNTVPFIFYLSMIGQLLSMYNNQN